MNPLLKELSEERLIWIQEKGVGYFEVNTDNVYDQSYFDKYRAMRNTSIATQLNKFRCSLTTDLNGPLIDVGIGDGAFVEAVEHAGIDVFGYDINPAGISWLKARGLWGDLYGQKWKNASFWDSLEHMRDPRVALKQIEDVALISIPIFKNVEHVLKSKHFRKDEHYWYFTQPGFNDFLNHQGFIVEYILDDETKIGREDIKTFVAKRFR